jgi:hypothetical protein
MPRGRQVITISAALGTELFILHGVDSDENRAADAHTRHIDHAAAEGAVNEIKSIS